MSASTSVRFTGDTFSFLEELAANNDRAWFARNRDRYERHVKLPALRLVEDIGPELGRISPHFSATPRSVFRIHRDTRFSRDKSPYKTHLGIQFRHQASGDVHAPGFYFHLEPASVFAALGMWRPPAAAARSVRERMTEDPAAWRRAAHDGAFIAGFRLEGEKLVRTPRGFDPESPLADDLRWKDFVAVRPLTRRVASSRRLPAELAAIYAEGAEFMRFLCGAVGVAF